MANNSHFANMPSISIPRSKFAQKFTHKTSWLHGDLIPIDCFEVLPGDSMKLELASLIRMSTPYAPIMDDIECMIHAYFVPMRLLWEHTEEFYGANKTSAGYQTVNYSIPNISIFDYGITSNAVSAYLGKPIVGYDGSKSAYGKVSVLKERAYWFIWSEWYRAQQLQAPFIMYTGDQGVVGTVGGTQKNFGSACAKVCKDFDYFTASVVSPQYGAAVQLPLGSTAPVIVPDTTAGSKTMLTNGTALYANDINHPVLADLTAATAATINELRYAFAVQKYLERSNYGSRFFEMLKVHYGVTSPDARLQRPEYLGGCHFLVNVQQVLSHAETTTNNETVALGTPGAVSVTGNKSFLFSKGFVEPGYVMVLLATRQKNQTYSQGLLREDTKFNRFEFYSPEFANLGDQATLKKEIYLAGNNSDEDVFGYQEHWAEYRYRPNRVSGLMNPSAANDYNFWSLANKFANQQSLTDSFIQESRDNIKRCLITGEEGPDFIGDFYFNYTSIRPMPVYTVPGLIDHFGVR